MAVDHARAVGDPAAGVVVDDAEFGSQHHLIAPVGDGAAEGGWIVAVDVGAIFATVPAPAAAGAGTNSNGSALAVVGSVPTRTGFVGDARSSYSLRDGRDFLEERSGGDAAVWVRLLGPGQDLGLWMYATNAAYRFAPVWLFRSLSLGFVGPRSREVRVRAVGPRSCPYAPWRRGDAGLGADVDAALRAELGVEGPRRDVLGLRVAGGLETYVVRDGRPSAGVDRALGGDGVFVVVCVGAAASAAVAAAVAYALVALALRATRDFHARANAKLAYETLRRHEAGIAYEDSKRSRDGRGGDRGAQLELPTGPHKGASIVLQHECLAIKCARRSIHPTRP